MGDIITPEEFDRIYDKIVWLELLDKELDVLKQPHRDFVKNKFLCEHTYKIYYENQEYYVLTDAYFRQLKSEKYI